MSTFHEVTPVKPPLDESPVPALQLVNVSKNYGGVKALRGANFVVTKWGTIHGLAGENGSGKSTLLGILSGQIRPDAGQMLLDGREVSFSSPASALAHGVAMVSQERALAEKLSVAENILLGRRMVRNAGGIDWAATRRKAVRVLDRLGLGYDPSMPVHRLRPDEQQMVEIARALSFDARVLILDEPTSSLTEDETERLFDTLRTLRSQGICTIFVSHRLAELFGLADELTVLRDGTTTAAGPVAEFDAEVLIDAMVGQKTELRTAPPAERGRQDHTHSQRALSVRGLTVSGAVESVDLDVYAGEIVGLAGLVGAGRSELLEAIFGARPRNGGSITVNGGTLSLNHPRTAVANGIGYLPADRKTAGLVIRRTIAENLTMVKTAFTNRLAAPNARADAETVAEAGRTMRMSQYASDRQVDTLSGGNQQKVALGKWIAYGPSVLLLDEPTRGVDIAAKADIQQLLYRSAGEGTAILISSSETPELLALCDRIHVMFRGAVVATLDAGAADEALIARYAGGHA
jgi:ABC-type sugar transport system ATPase subunit